MAGYFLNRVNYSFQKICCSNTGARSMKPVFFNGDTMGDAGLFRQLLTAG